MGCALSIIFDYELVKDDHTYAKVTKNETFEAHYPDENVHFDTLPIHI